MIKRKILFLMLFVTHFLIASSSLTWSTLWAMNIFDVINPQQVVAPLGFQIVGWVASIFSAPLFLLPRTPYLNNLDAYINPILIFILMLVLNSLFVCYLLTFIWERIRQK